MKEDVSNASSDKRARFEANAVPVLRSVYKRALRLKIRHVIPVSIRDLFRILKKGRAFERTDYRAATRWWRTRCSANPGTTRSLAEFIPVGTPERTPNLCYNRCAFAIPAAGALGNTCYNGRRLSVCATVDWSLHAV